MGWMLLFFTGILYFIWGFQGGIVVSLAFSVLPLYGLVCRDSRKEKAIRLVIAIFGTADLLTETLIYIYFLSGIGYHAILLGAMWTLFASGIFLTTKKSAGVTSHSDYKPTTIKK